MSFKHLLRKEDKTRVVNKFCDQTLPTKVVKTMLKTRVLIKSCEQNSRTKYMNKSYEQKF